MVEKEPRSKPPSTPLASLPLLPCPTFGGRYANATFKQVFSPVLPSQKHMCAAESYKTLHLGFGGVGGRERSSLCLAQFFPWQRANVRGRVRMCVCEGGKRSAKWGT